MNAEIPEPWSSFLREIDSSLTERTELHCIGGFVIRALYNFDRVTSDLDFIACVPKNVADNLYAIAGKNSPLFEKYRVFLDPVTVVTPPDYYEDRLTEMFPGMFGFLRLLALDPYDLALTKLERSASTAHDLEDILHLARTLPFDLNIFRERYEKEFRIYVEDNVRHRGTFDHWIRIISEERESRD